MKLLLTGGTGFVGRSILPALIMNQFEVTVVGRSNQPPILPKGVHYQSCNVLGPIDISGVFDVIIHAATDASALLNSSNPKLMFETVIRGTANVLEFAGTQQKPPIVCFTSSGGVYGELPDGMQSFEEDCRLAPPSFDVRSAYAEGKRAAEFLLAEAASRGVCIPRLARLFAFSGTLLPIDRHFAIGNFVRDAVNRQSIEVRGDGKAIRSYMDQDDLADWMLAIILRGLPTSVYHIGSERAISIGDLAHLVANRYEVITTRSCAVKIKGQTSPLDGVHRYVPSTTKTRSELNLQERVSLEDSIDKMITAHLCD